jgi:seryl-tRNA synthetase
MLDIKLIRENRKLIEEALKKREIEFDLDKIISVDKRRKELQIELENLLAQKNKSAKKYSSLSEKEKQKLKKEMQDLEIKIKKLEKAWKKADLELANLLAVLPNIPHESVSAGDETKNEVIKKVGKPTQFDFPAKDHVELGKINDLIDIDRAVKISGARFYFLKNEAVQLEFALINFVLSKLISKGFTPMIPPVLVKEMAMFGTGHFPADKNEIYCVNPEEDNLYLIGTSEVPLIGYHANEILKEDELPKKYCAFSSCFRREAGSYGKDTRGILRVHQFDKIEQVVICHPEESWKMFDEIVANQEEILKELGIPYQVVALAAGDMGPAAAKQIDLESWLPSANCYREITSASNTTDYQSRRQAIRFKTNNGENKLVHTLNGTGCAIGRTLIAIIENYQQKDGSIVIPDILRPYMNEIHKISPKKSQV